MNRMNEFGLLLQKNETEYSLSEALSKHTTFRIGGRADILIMPDNEKKLISALNFINEHNIKCEIIGNGSNVLFDDNDYHGAVISLKKMRGVSCTEDTIYAYAGESLSRVAETALENNLTGLEFTYGIPGSVGGAVYMNAGAYGGEISDVFVSALCYNRNTKCMEELDLKNMRYSYRHSILQDRHELVVVKTQFRLRFGEYGAIKTKMDENVSSRKAKQPIEYSNAGSVFKRHGDFVISKIIDDLGMKGMRIGDAEVSVKHAGFIVNRGYATSRDVRQLISQIQIKIYQSYGFMPECEIKFIES